MNGFCVAATNYMRVRVFQVLNSPLNAVKEMLENSLDAGAKEVRVSIERGGLDKIEVEVGAQRFH